jgi:uncharacterized phage protein gp47/JayE
VAITSNENEDFLPLFPEETEETIRARWDAWANEGLTPDDVDDWTDTREGSFFQINTQTGVREAARVYDVMGTEFVAAGIPFWSWGTYLDDIALTFQLERQAAVKAEGTVTFTGDDGTVIPAGTGVAAEAASEADDAREYETTEEVTIASGTADATIEAQEAGSASDAAALAVDILLTDVDGVASVSNADPIVGGTDPETDESLRDRLLREFSPRSGGNVADYERWALDFPGVGRVTVRPLWAGPGTVQVVILTEDGDPVAGSVVTGLQEFLDPDAGLGHGQAPIDHVVTVTTAAAVSVPYSATVELEPGYTLTGLGGTVNLTDAITAALRSYVNGQVVPGDEVVLAQADARVASITGVHDVGLGKLNSVAANFDLDDAPMQVAELGTVTLTEGTL